MPHLISIQLPSFILALSKSVKIFEDFLKPFFAVVFYDFSKLQVGLKRLLKASWDIPNLLKDFQDVLEKLFEAAPPPPPG